MKKLQSILVFLGGTILGFPLLFIGLIATTGGLPKIGIINGLIYIAIAIGILLVTRICIMKITPGWPKFMKKAKTGETNLLKI